MVTDCIIMCARRHNSFKLLSDIDKVHADAKADGVFLNSCCNHVLNHDSASSEYHDFDPAQSLFNSGVQADGRPSLAEEWSAEQRAKKDAKKKGKKK